MFSCPRVAFMNKKKYIYCEINHLTFMLRYILVVTVDMKVENDGRENTIVSSHTFVPRFRWDYYNSGDWYYNVYPFVPIEN